MNSFPPACLLYGSPSRDALGCCATSWTQHPRARSELGRRSRRLRLNGGSRLSLPRRPFGQVRATVERKEPRGHGEVRIEQAPIRPDRTATIPASPQGEQQGSTPVREDGQSSSDHGARRRFVAGNASVGDGRPFLRHAVGGRVMNPTFPVVASLSGMADAMRRFIKARRRGLHRGRTKSILGL